MLERGGAADGGGAEAVGPLGDGLQGELASGGTRRGDAGTKWRIPGLVGVGAVLAQRGEGVGGGILELGVARGVGALLPDCDVVLGIVQLEA